MQYKEKNVQLCGLMMIGLFIYTFGSSLLLHFFFKPESTLLFLVVMVTSLSHDIVGNTTGVSSVLGSF